ncbi:metalloregulator ArsR/SmtB family transcription factor [Planotetraspora sp. A-T 1434]|uniref:ArsR/SmtB family transcription factor n=1 Tax=Planotetraspora sp. A-T 1434 TaxID=2979219 RepID=UPI0021C1DCC8|nr:metalloregulator ArsR/SmtB family transcription factor [Planotetraspora sp. A-T 1434]MCT9933389.1 metalloregulator ArsR/SmtB family transcription factor [Planotetraspora sp. A-T 1434]
MEIREVDTLVDAVFAALANPARRELLRRLRDGGAQPVRELAAGFSMSRPSVSEHLKALKDAGLVSEEKSGRHRYYRLEAAPLMGIRDWLTPYEDFWRGRLTSLRSVLEDMDTEDTDTEDTDTEDTDMEETDD